MKFNWKLFIYYYVSVIFFCFNSHFQVNKKQSKVSLLDGARKNLLKNEYFDIKLIFERGWNFKCLH